MKRINEQLAIWLSRQVSTMWCAYLFCFLAFLGIPHSSDLHDWVQWISQTFIQLVMLAVILVAQDVNNRKSEERMAKMFSDIETLFDERLKVECELEELQIYEKKAVVEIGEIETILQENKNVRS